jgi:hypothetical protein
MPELTRIVVQAVQPFADWYAGAARVQAGTSFLHFAGLLASGGFAIATDRTVWRARRAPSAAARHRVLAEIASVHRPVLIGLAIVFVTGAMLALADAEAFLTSAVFWLKMGLVALLLANGAWLGHTERRLASERAPSDARWRLLLVASATSIALWFAVLLAGVLLTTTA